MTVETAKPGWFGRLAHPGYFLEWSRHFILPLAVLTAVLFAVGLFFALFHSPEDYQMGQTVRIMYVHVPNAWLAEMCFVLMALSSVGTLVWRHPMADVAAKSAAPLGATVTAVALYTGALWGRPTWGTYWEWDGRMTSFLILFLMYLGIIALWRAFDDQLRAAKIVAVFTLVSVVNIPIIIFSVVWWNTLHQPSSLISAKGPQMPPSFLIPLFLMMGAFTCLFATLHIVRMRTEIKRRRIRSLERQHAAALAGGGA